MGQIGGFCHLYIGQEAVVVGMQMAIGEGDQVITAYRDHGHMLACGMDPKGVMAELTGRSGGYSKGKGGSMHMFSVEKGFYGGHGIVGAQVPLGTGIAFANKYRGNGRVCFTYYGDGAANQGQVYEAFNMAELWRLPVVYVVENNKYGMGTRVDGSRQRPIFPNAARASAFRANRWMAWTFAPSKRPENGLSLMRAAVTAHTSLRCSPIAIAGIRCPTRQISHKEEVDKMRQGHDPIEQVRLRLISSGQASEDELKSVDKEIRAIVNEAAEFAQRDPEPDPAELYTDVLLRTARRGSRSRG